MNEADIDLGPLKISDDFFSNPQLERNIGKKPIVSAYKHEHKQESTSETTLDNLEDPDVEKEPELNINPAVCTTCNKTFKSKYILNVHLKRHKFKGQFLCTLCGKGFNSQGCLNRHTRVHTGNTFVFD